MRTSARGRRARLGRQRLIERVARPDVELGEVFAEVVLHHSVADEQPRGGPGVRRRRPACGAPRAMLRGSARRASASSPPPRRSGTAPGQARSAGRAPRARSSRTAMSRSIVAFASTRAYLGSSWLSVSTAASEPARSSSRGASSEEAVRPRLASTASVTSPRDQPRRLASSSIVGSRPVAARNSRRARSIDCDRS